MGSDRFDACLVERHFSACIAPRLDEFAERFYQRLFLHHPALKGLFRSSPERQREHFSFALRMIVSSLADPESRDSLLSTLAGAHAAYGVNSEHLSDFGESLIATLRETSGAAWSPQLEDSWGRAYAWIAGYFRGNGHDHRRIDTAETAAHGESRSRGDLFQLAEEYLELARERRKRGALPMPAAARLAQLRDELERQISGCATPFPQRRRALRVPASCRVEFCSAEASGIGRLAAVSERGIFIATECLLSPGAELRALVYPESQADAIELSGTIVWSRPASSPAGPAGFAIRLGEADERLLELVGRRLFASLRLRASASSGREPAAPTHTSKSDS